MHRESRRISAALAAGALVALAGAAPPAAGQNQTGGAAGESAAGQQGDEQQGEGGQAAPRQPQEAPDAQEGVSVPEPDFTGTIRLPAFTEPVQIRTLIDYAIREIGVQIAVDTEFDGSVVLTQPIEVAKRDYLRLLNSFIEQHGFALYETEIPHFYAVRRGERPPVRLGGELASTVVIPTPNMRPSSLEQILVQQFGVEGTPGALRASYIDDLGVILATGSPRQLRAVRELVERMVAGATEQKLIPFDLTYVTAPEARKQALELVGLLEGDTQRGTPRGRGEQQQQQQIQPGGASGSLSNLASKLIVARSGNTLMFKGTDMEAQRVAELLELIDRPNNLQPKQYFTGTQTSAVAQFAETRGLGTVVRVSQADFTQQGQLARQQRELQQQMLGGGETQSVGGSLLVADEQRGRIVYYGTPQQHAELEALVEQIGAEAEQIVMRAYRLNWANAEDVAEIVTGLIERRQPAIDSPLAARGGPLQQQQQQQRRQPGVGPELPEGEQADTVTDIDEESFIIADTGNNQVFVRARLAEQPQFARLIDTIDRRRPQVYLETKIVAVTWTDDLRLAFESQVVSGQFGFRSDFGLTAPGDTFLDPVNVASGLGGFTGALIKNKYVPIVVNALQREVNGRIVSAPQILVDDNEETMIASVEEQPTTTTTVGETTDQVSFAGFEEAGTTLTVTPRISPGGFVTLDYQMELSDFIGQGSEGIPASKNTQNIEGYVTIPSDSTVIVGGIQVDDETDTIVKIPLLGDIPLIKYLFRDTNLSNRKTELLVFITPRILYEPTLSDYQLLTKGPQAEAMLDPDIPPLTTFMVQASSLRPRDSRQMEDAVAPAPIPSPGSGPEGGE